MDIKKAVSDMYQFESEDSLQEAKTKMLSIAVDADHASMLRAISERFGESLSSFAGQFLEDFTKEVFFHLTDEDKLLLAEKADKETSEYLSKRGIKVTGIDHAGEYEGSRHWQGIAHIYTRSEEGDES